MKSRNFPRLLTIAAVTVTCLFARDMMAQKGSSDAATIPNVAPTAAPAGGAPVELSYGMPQVLQLVKAKVSENVILTYVQNSGNRYGLNANQIVYLRQQGVSDAIITAMLNQHAQVAQAAPQQNYSDANSAPTATVVAQPATAYVQTVPSSTVYVIPDTQTYRYYNGYYDSYPYYGGYYYGWPYPALSFSFGFGGGYRGGYYHGGWGGGYRGGYYGGGGYRGGGGSHGGGHHH